MIHCVAIQKRHLQILQNEIIEKLVLLIFAQIMEEEIQNLCCVFFQVLPNHQFFYSL